MWLQLDLSCELAIAQMAMSHMVLEPYRDHGFLQKKVSG